MSAFTLGSPREAEDLIADLFKNNMTCRLSAREDMAFKDDLWFDLGQIEMFPAAGDFEKIRLASRRGQYEWNLPSCDDAKETLDKILVGPLSSNKSDPARRASKIRRCLDSIAAIATRIGLIHPRFDPHLLAAMPYRRPVSIVADTSGIVQGGLDFAARFLSPVARTKIPAIAQMEIVNFSHRFLSNSRSGAVKGLDLLIDHLLSQGAQRVLLRLELRSDIEIERTFLLGDPLRSAFSRDDDSEIKDLNLSTDVPAYADRLIVEAARHHQMQSGPGHPVLLLTSDQGLAKMALSEGISPLFFRSVENGQLFGRKLTGVNLHPFGGKLQRTSLSSLLWECAVSFGRAKLTYAEGTKSLEVAAFGKEFSWSPFHSRADLLWIDSSIVSPKSDPPITFESKTVVEPAVPVRPATDHIGFTRPSVASAGAPSAAMTGWYTFKVQVLFDLIERLDDQQELTENEVLALVGTKAKSGAEEYRRFFRSGDLIPAKAWTITPALQKLAIALRQVDITAARSVLKAVPSVSRVLESLENTEVGQDWDTSIINRGTRAYLTLGEVLLAGASISKDSFYPTPNRPSAREFSIVALETFRSLDTGDGLISTGKWLETLIQKSGIHPETSRDLLREASAAGLLQRSTEGSTTDTRHDDHKISVLRLRAGRPVVESVHLYRGDYLIPGKSSSSLRIGAV